MSHSRIILSLSDTYLSKTYFMLHTFLCLWTHKKVAVQVKRFPFSLEVEVDAESRTSPPPDASTSPHPPPSSSPSSHPPPPAPPPDTESIHEYERIGLSNNSAQTALLSEQDNASSRGSSLLQTWPWCALSVKRCHVEMLQFCWILLMETREGKDHADWRFQGINVYYNLLNALKKYL
jgi:hypothetical protein